MIAAQKKLIASSNAITVKPLENEEEEEYKLEIP